MMNARWIPMESASTPCSTGRKAPPTMAMISRPDPLPVSGPREEMPSVEYRSGGGADDPRPRRAIVNDIQIAEGRHDECQLDSDGVGQHALQHRQKSAADNGHDQQARPLAGQRTQGGDAQR